ncbi:hypothetical protein [Thermococcus sp. JCM 11816]|uniref:hypothetical protein n=1 Tax=Thermococcus sp. (strain JCM 11816 / KS-1) TaxID=1295125 RepID=UPI0006CF2B71
MGIFEEGRTDCVKSLLKPAERVLKQGLDISVESYERRERLWNQVLENYDRYLDGKCGGDFLRDLDQLFRSKFEGALAILAWSFWSNGETYLPASRRFKEKELAVLERVLSYNVFEIYTKEDIMKKIMHRDVNVLLLLRDYYHGIDKWIEEALNDPEIKLPLRLFIKRKWDSYKGKVNDALNEAITRFDWLRDLLTMTREEIEAIEKTYQKKISEKDRELAEKEKEIEALKEGIAELIQGFELEKQRLMEEMSRANEEEIERLKREKEELQRRFEEERQRLIEEISRMKDEEARKTLEEQLQKAREEMLSSLRAMEEEIRRKELELRQKEMELKRREMELSKKEDEVAKRIKEVMELTGKVEKGSRFVKRDEARIMEMNFIGRLRSKLKGEVELLGKTFKVEAVEEKPTFDKSPYLGKLSDRDIKNVPDNMVLEVTLKEKKLFGKKEEFRVKALFYSRPERYADVGFDTDPVELADINALLTDAREDAVKGRLVLLVASPTGFERRIKNYINSENFHRNFISEKISLALLDLESGELTINPPNDEYAKAFEPYLKLERDEELMNRLKNLIEEGIMTKGYVVLEEMLKHGAEDAIKRAFHELSKEKGYITKFIDGVGFVIAREGGFI